MKKTVLSIALSFAVLWSFCFSAFAVENPPTVIRTDFPDGSYSIRTVVVVKIYPSSDGTRYSITGTAYQNYYNSNNVLQFTVSVKGTFTYNLENAYATSAQYKYSISNSAWSFVSGSASCSGATATASCTFHLANGPNKTLSVSLTCSPLGVLS